MTNPPFEKLCGEDNWQRGFRSLQEDGPRAVRWAVRDLKRMFQPNWTKWHYTEGSGHFTACGKAVVPFVIDGSPQEADLHKITCRRCAVRFVSLVGQEKEGSV